MFTLKLPDKSVVVLPKVVPLLPSLFTAYTVTLLIDIGPWTAIPDNATAGVGVGVGVEVAVAVGVEVAVWVGVAVGVSLGVAVAVAVGVGAGRPTPAKKTSVPLVLR